MLTDFNIGMAIKNCRLKYGLTQEELSKNICDQTLISRIEKGKVVPSSYILMMFSERMGIDVKYLLDLAKYNNVNYVKEVTSQVERMLKTKSFAELKAFVKYEKQNPLFQSIDGDRYFLWLEGISAYYVDKETSYAIKLLKQAIDHRNTTDKSKSDLDITILNSLSIIYGEEKEYINASKVYQILYREVEHHPSIDSKLKVKVLYNYSKVLIHLEEYDFSMKVCKKAIRECNDNDSLYLLGNLYYQVAYIATIKKDYKQALTAINTAISIFTVENKDNFIELAQKKKSLIHEQSGHI
jgi:transcriptional regulator with XRE-family HTH domain